jgi:glycosyltransferase involved in cell wall biosynthesis
MRIGVLTTLWPLSTRPQEGLFALRRWQHMRARGHQVHVVHPLPWAPPVGPRAWRELARVGAREALEGLEVEHPRYVHVPRAHLANARRAAAVGVRVLLARGRPEVAIADYAWPMALCAEALSAAGVPLVVHGRGSDVLQVAGDTGLAPHLAAALRCAGTWCAVSRHLVARMDELGGAPGRGRLVPNGVDTRTFHLQDRAACRARLGLEPDGPLVLVVGHLIERKDPALALEAFARLAARRPAARLFFVGRGALRDALREQARRAGLEARVAFVGEVPAQRLAEWYGACDVLLLTSRREGRPNVVLEALACGRAVLATDAGGTAELLGGLEGSLCTSRDPAPLAQALDRLCDAPPDPLALRARVAGYGWEASCAALEACLAQAVEGAA